MLLVRGVDEVAAIVCDHSQPGVVERAGVEIIEILGRFYYRRLKLDTGDALYRELLDRAERDAAAQTYQ